MRSASIAMLAVAACALGPAGCVDRLIHDRLCGDGQPSRGELCLGLGDRTRIAIDTLDPLALRVADFDGDAQSDVMVLGTDADGVVAARLWQGDGAGGVLAPLDPGVFGCSAHPVPGPVDDDGITDLLVDECGPSVSLFVGTATGVFQPPLSVPVGVPTRSSGLLDLDADGHREVVVLGRAEAGPLALTVAERQDTGTFAAPLVSELPVMGDYDPSGFGMLDLDADGILDALLVHGGRPDSLAISRGLPQLAFAPPQPVTPPGLLIDGAAVRDLDGDGTAEIFALSFSTESMLVLEVSGGQLVERSRTEVPGLAPSPAALADLDGDGVLDLLRVQADEANLEAWLGRRSGSWSGPTIIDLDIAVDQMAVADFDGDDVLDVVVGSFEDASVRVLLSDP